jgi:hypothetical protein
MATTISVNSGRRGASAPSARAPSGWTTDRSSAKNRPNTAHSTPITASHGSAISAAKRPKVSPLAANASRLVRLETGSSSDAEFARCVHAYTGGLDRTFSVAVVASTTGVSRTTVASRLSTAVVTAAITNT